MKRENRNRGWLVVPLLAGAALALPARADAQDSASVVPAGLTLAEAARLALAGYPAVAASTAEVREARSTASRTAAARWPTLHLNGSVMRYEEPMLVTPLHGFDDPARAPFEETLVQGSVSARYTLWDGGERGGSIERARSLTRAASASLESTRGDVVLQVTQQYAQVLAARVSLDAHEQRVRALAEELDRARRLFMAGRGAQLDVLRAEAGHAQALAEHSRAASELDVSLRGLARLIGAPAAELDADALVAPTPAGAALPARESLLARAEAANPDVQRAQAELAAAQAEVKVARAALLPDVQLVGQYDSRGSTEGDFFREWSVGGAVSVPLFQGGARLHEMQRAGARRERLESHLELVRLRTADELDRALAALRDAEARQRSLGAAVEQYTAVVRAERLALETGVGTQNDYLTAQADLLRARAQLAESVTSGITARAEIARITGELDVDWLRANMETR